MGPLFEFESVGERRRSWDRTLVSALPSRACGRRLGRALGCCSPLSSCAKPNSTVLEERHSDLGQGATLAELPVLAGVQSRHSKQTGDPEDLSREFLNVSSVL